MLMDALVYKKYKCPKDIVLAVYDLNDHGEFKIILRPSENNFVPLLFQIELSSATNQNYKKSPIQQNV